MKGIGKKLISIWDIHSVRIFLLYVLAAFIAHLDRFVLGSYALFKVHDQLDSYWPYQVALAQRLFSFHLPLWFPDYMGGMPFPYMDINWLFFPVLWGGLFRDPLASALVTWAEFVMAGFGAYLFIQHFFKKNAQYAFLGGLMCALATYSLTYFRIFDLAVIPLLFYCTDKIVWTKKRAERLLLLLGLIIAASNIFWAKGAPFIAAFHIVFIWLSYPNMQQRKKIYLSFFIIWCFIAMLNLPTILSLASSVPVGSRGLMNWMPDHPIGFWERLRFSGTIIMSQAAMSFGAIGTLCFFFGLLNLKRWEHLLKGIFLFYLGVILFAAFIDSAVWFQSLKQHLVLLRDFRLSRFVLPGPFIILLIIFANLESFIEFSRSSIKKVMVFFLLGAGMIIYFHLWKHTFPEKYIHAFTASLALFMLGGLFWSIRRFPKLKPYWIMIILSLLIFSERFVDINLTRFIDGPSFRNYFISPTFKTFIPQNKYDYRIAFINLDPTKGLYNDHQVAGGYASQYLKRYGIFWETLLTYKNREFLSYPFRAYLIAKITENNTINEPPFMTKLLALNNVRYIFSPVAIEYPQKWGLSLAHSKAADLGLVGNGLYRKTQKVTRYLIKMFNPQDYYVYEVKKWIPRTFMAGNYGLLKDAAALRSALRQSSGEELRDRVLYNQQDLTAEQIIALEKSSPKALPEIAPNIIFYSDNKIVINAKNRSLCQLVLVENYLHEWEVKINGKSGGILPAYGVFRSVLLTPGNNEVVFEYKPHYLINAYWISGIGALLMIISAGIWAIKTGNQKENT